MDRVSAAKDRLEAVKLVAIRAREAGPPCSDCHFRTLLGMCGNPVYAEPKFEAVTGEYSERFSTPVADARADDGACGPEALLFEPQMLPVTVAKSAWAGARAVLHIVAAMGLLVGLWLMLNGY